MTIDDAIRGNVAERLRRLRSAPLAFSGVTRPCEEWAARIRHYDDATIHELGVRVSRLERDKARAESR